MEASSWSPFSWKISRFLLLGFIKSTIRKSLRSGLIGRLAQCGKSHSSRLLFGHMLKITLLLTCLVVVKIKSRLRSWETESSALNGRRELCAYTMQPHSLFLTWRLLPCPPSASLLGRILQSKHRNKTGVALMTAFIFEDRHPTLPKSLLPWFFQLLWFNFQSFLSWRQQLVTLESPQVGTIPLQMVGSQNRARSSEVG